MERFAGWLDGWMVGWMDGLLVCWFVGLLAGQVRDSHWLFSLYSGILINRTEALHAAIVQASQNI